MSPPRAAFSEPQSWDAIGCNLCPLQCSIAPNRAGQCGVRTNRRGELTLETWGKITVAGPVDSDALPLYHFNPWVRWFLLGMRGCNMRCAFCNTSNYSLQGGVSQQQAYPQDVVAWAAADGCRGVSFGINEPIIAFEYVADVFDSARQFGLQTHLATNGYINEEPLRLLCQWTSAMTIGLKGPTGAFYDRTTGGDLRSSIQTARIAGAMGVHVELSYLVIPGQTDTPGGAAMLIELLESLGPRTPVVLLAYEPAYTWLDTQPATAATLDRFREKLGPVAHRAYSHHAESAWLNTRCAKCSKVLVRRGVPGYLVTQGDGRVCPSCGDPLPFAGMGNES
jgi:pyruvate formate lyase activating enzyme